MTTTVITHIYNESYLLPIWLRHHRERFDHGIIVDCGSTDNPREIVDDLAPGWDFMSTNLESFDAVELDAIINCVERAVQGTRIVLTITEFLLGQPRLAERQYLIPQVMLINMSDEVSFDPLQPFHDQVQWGIGSDTETIAPWWSRSMHQTPTTYGADGSLIGRHYHGIDNGPYLIYRVSNCFVNEEMFERRLQIQHRIPQVDKNRQMGYQHHNWGNGLTRDDLISQQNELRRDSRDIGELLAKYNT
jgi:hypothetical protein